MKANTQDINVINLGPTNCYLIKYSGGYLLVDTSEAKYYQKFIEELGKINVDVSEIKYLLLTHHHYDHAGFAAKLKAQINCRIICHKNSIISLKNGKSESHVRPINWLVYLISSIGRLFHKKMGFTPVIPDKNDVISSGEDDDTLRQAGINGKLIYTPGHTDDSISLIMDDGNAFVGDVATNINILNFGGVKYRPMYVEDLSPVFESWQKIIDNNATMVYPSHGKPFPITELNYYIRKFANKG